MKIEHSTPDTQVTEIDFHFVEVFRTVPMHIKEKKMNVFGECHK